MAGSGDLTLALRIQADVAQANAALKQTSAQIDAVGASAKQASSGSASYTAQMSAQVAASQKAGVAAKDLAESLALMGKIDPAGAKLGQLDALEAQLGRLHKAGAIGAADFEHLGGILTAQRNKLAAAGEGAEKAAAGMAHLSLNTSFARREFGRLGTDILTGNYGRLEQTSLTLANATGLLGPLFTATGAAIAGVVAVIGGYIAAVAAGEAQQHELETALIATGNVAGTTAGQLGAMRDRIGQATGSFGDAQTALIVLAQSGKLGAQSLESLGRSAVNLSQLTGESVDKVAAEIAKIGDAPSKTIVELNDKYHFLTLATYEQIRALEDQGNAQAATGIATHALQDATDQATEEMKKKTGILARAWDAVTDAIKGAIQAAKDAGRTDTDYLLNIAKINLKYARDKVSAEGNYVDPIDAAALSKAKAEQHRLMMASVGESLAAQLQMFQQMASDAGIKATSQAADMTKQLREQTVQMGQQTELARVKYQIEQGSLKGASDSAKQQLLAAAAAKDAEQARLDAQRKGGGRAGGLGIDRAQLADDVAAYQSAWQTAQKTFGNAERQLDAQRKADAISDKAYFAAKQADIDALLAAQLKALAAERAGLLAHATTAAQRIRVDGQVRDIDAKVEQARQDAAAKTDELQQRSAENDKQRAQQYSQLQQQYYEAIGDTGAAQLLRVQEQFDKAMQTMTAAANTDGQKIAKELFDVETARAHLAQIEQAAERAFGQIDLISQRASADQQAGLITERAARQQVIDANLRYAQSLQKDIVAAKALADATNNRSDILHYEQLVEKVRELTLVTSALGQQVQTTLTDSFSSFLQNVFTRAQNLRQAFADLFRSIAQGLAKIAADNISQTLFAKLHSLFNPGSSPAASAAGNAASAAALTTAAGAAAPILGAGVTAGGATAATAMSTAIITAGATAATEMATAIASAGIAGGAGNSGGGALSIGRSIADIVAGVPGAATGGAVDGPGTETSDSILARLSRGEYVVNARAVRAIGVHNLHAINQRRFPAFAQGGPVGPVPRLAEGPVGGHGLRPQVVKIVPVFDPAQIAGAMASRAGEQVHLMHFRNNLPALRAMLGTR
ncbi:MAG: phage tail length tape measure family protein [Proteobacteria bacterium]|nr:phage tail length tape measure family protein [Pseudomonadota bacterium]